MAPTSSVKPAFEILRIKNINILRKTNILKQLKKKYRKIIGESLVGESI